MRVESLPGNPFCVRRLTLRRADLLTDLSRLRVEAAKPGNDVMKNLLQTATSDLATAEDQASKLLSGTKAENDKLSSDWGLPGCQQPRIWASIEQ